MNVNKVNKVLTVVLGAMIIAECLLLWELWEVLNFQALQISCTPNLTGA